MNNCNFDMDLNNCCEKEKIYIPGPQGVQGLQGIPGPIGARTTRRKRRTGGKR